MTAFTDFLSQHLEAGGLPTEDALACFLPLVRQVASAHRAGVTAPLEGVNALHVEFNRLWYEDSLNRPPSLQNARVREVERPGTTAIEIVAQYRLDVVVGAGRDAVSTLQIGRRGEPVTRPVYLPGYVAWEHELGHHDALTDVFVLGLILASLSCGLDLNEPESLDRFVQCRRNLFELNPQLHPVLAKAIVRMTELDRHRRPQDTALLLRTLENYRDQNIDFDFDLARLPEFEAADRPGRRSLILTCLQQRLFDITRRNRLLHFRPTMQTVNLTWASVPVSLDVRNIRPEQILTWGHDFREAVTSGGPVSLNKYLRFEDAPYLPGQLDAIRNEARRDQNEYGFAQLRLVVCFLRWSNLKEKPPDRFDSPLVLLPVRLAKNKGVRDVFTIEAAGTEAEINPALRFYLKQLYAVELPESVDLAKDSLDELYALLASQVQASEPAITIEKIDRPRINIIHAKAQRRLEQYRRRTRLSGRGVRTYLDVDYSYSRSNYHPLGLRLFQTRVLPAEPRLRSLVEEVPRPRMHAIPEAPPVEIKERQLYSRAEEETNPYRWEFDLCNVTVGNFHYRKMSLVRDYTVLRENGGEHEGFDAIFTPEPREHANAAPPPLPLDDRYPIVPCDPTQASAIALARNGKSFIIQGPPGTGKSQTITNLIADFVARGQRVLFVCEKRAAIDVVYQRLEAAGLKELCCLIHDAQDDKKEFIADLKATYETFQGIAADDCLKTEKDRRRGVEALAAALAPLEKVHDAMTSVPPPVGVPLHHLFYRAVELRDVRPQLSPTDREILPPHALWEENRERIERVREYVELIRPDGVLARHPLRSLHTRFAEEERPLAAIHELLLVARSLLDHLSKELEKLDVPDECRDRLDRARESIEYAVALGFLAEVDGLEVLRPKSAQGRSLANYRKKYAAKERELSQARGATANWRNRLPPEETRTALEQMRDQERSIWRFLQPSWWRLRSQLRAAYDFGAHQVRPSYSSILEQLQAEHRIVSELSEIEAAARDDLNFTGSFEEFSERVARLVEGAGKLSPPLAALHQQVIASEAGDEVVRELAALNATVAQLGDVLGRLLDDVAGWHLREIREELSCIEQSLDELPAFVPCLKELAGLPPALGRAWRRTPLDPEQLEAAIAGNSVDDVLRADPQLARFDADAYSRQVDRLETLHDRWQSLNASTVRARACGRFLENLRIASLPHGQLSAEQKEFKTRYNRGRRELEHEFGKTMRFRSIRDLVDDETGLVLRDLKPVWLMSPLSVADALPLEVLFDVVIFDEASQVTLEESIPTIFRARQVLVVGDEMQLPPTSFFGSRSDEEETVVVVEDTGEEVEYDLSSDSLLNHAARRLFSTMLGWHYRSRSELLISFSNAAFYQGRLLTVPDVALPATSEKEIVVPAPTEGGLHADSLLGRPISFHFLEKGVYELRRNAAEAEYIAHLVRGLFQRGQPGSIGIIAFSEAQQGEIERALDRLAEEDPDFRERLEAERDREVDGQFVGLLVKNLENIQGDERDIIILSVCYGPNVSGKMLMNFGPINQSGGERRLNVAFSRAKKHMAVISSIRHSAITNDYNDGARALKNYLSYAEAISAGNVPAARRVLAEVHPGDHSRGEAARVHVVSEEIAARLQRRGYEVDRDLGQSDLRCDLAVRRPGDDRYRLGLFIDTPAYYQNRDILERDIFRPGLLRAFGWKILQVFTKDWLDNADEVIDSIIREMEPADVRG